VRARARLDLKPVARVRARVRGEGKAKTGPEASSKG
jgi:hypothetical protein